MRKVAAQDASEAHINVRLFIATIECESHFDPKAIGDTAPKYHGASYGIVQIHLIAHPALTKAEAMDPIFALKWAATQFAQGNQNEWSCYRIVSR